MTRHDRRSIALAIALSVLAGYVDATGFLASGGFFVSFMSGNSTRLAVGLNEGRFAYALLGFGVIVTFVMGVALGTLVARRAGQRRKPAVLSLVLLLLLAAALARSLEVAHFGTAALILAMGAENAIFQREGEITIGVTYMTGTLVKLGQRIAGTLHGEPPWAWTPYALLWLGLVTGACGGTSAYFHLLTHSLWPAVAYALILVLVALRLPLPSADRGT
jgi:uncharacterized membrane protein YoaK (UPF0700 family)